MKELSRSPSRSRSNTEPSRRPAARTARFANLIRRFPRPPLGVLWDPFLLNRLQTPLTRYRD